MCVIDQYVCSSLTLRASGLLLSMAGIPVITAMEGHWYHDIRPDHISLSEMTSDHADFMHDIGIQAARQGEPSMNDILDRLKAQAGPAPIQQ